MRTVSCILLMLAAAASAHHRTVRLLIRHRRQFEILMSLSVLLQFKSRVAGANRALLSLVVLLVHSHVRVRSCAPDSLVLVEARNRFVELILIVLVTHARARLTP